jgi:hypothetical protein
MMELVSVEFISSVGFPITAWFYMAYKFEATLSKNTEAIHALKEEIRRQGPKGIA